MQVSTRLMLTGVGWNHHARPLLFRCLEHLLGDGELPTDDRATVAAMLECTCSGPSRAPLLRAIMDALGRADRARAAISGTAFRPVTETLPCPASGVHAITKLRLTGAISGKFRLKSCPSNVGI